MSTLLTRWLEKEITELATEQKCSYYLSVLKETLWPQGVLDDQVVPPPPSDEQRQVTKQQAQRCLGEFLPGVF